MAKAGVWAHGLTIVALVLGTIAAAAGQGRAQIQIDITGPSSKLAAIATPQLKNLGGDDNGAVSGEFVETLDRDLQLSGYFRVIDHHAYIEDSQTSGIVPGQINFANWSSINAEFLVKGTVQANSNQVSLEAILYDVASQHQLMGKRFSGSNEDVRRMARRFADAVLQNISGQQGPFDSKLAFVSTRGGRFKEIYTMAIDGADLFRITNNPTINLSPSFDHAVRHLLYTSYKSGTPTLYLYDLAARRETRLENRAGSLIGGTLTPDGNGVIAAIENGGATNLYLLDLHGAVLSQLTHGSAINVSPSVSSDGTRIAFVSDRAGTPQIYVMGIDGGAAHRISYQGNYNTNPAFSPKGDKIAYQSRNGGFQICVIGAQGGTPTRLAAGEHPSWSPDGRYLAFSARAGGVYRVYLMDSESGRIIGPLTKEDGNATDPAWSWWLGE